MLGKHELDELLAERDKLNLDIQQILDAQTDAWGIKVANVEIKHVDLERDDGPRDRAAGRGRARAPRQVIHAEGELQAAEKLRQAAQMLAREPQAMQLRYLETLTVSPATRARPSCSRYRWMSSARFSIWSGRGQPELSRRRI